MIRKMRQGYVGGKNHASCYVTTNGSRYELFFARDFEGKINVTTKEVPMLGGVMKGHRATAADGKFKLTIYRITDLFNRLILDYLDTGIMPEFEIQVTEEDPATKMGRSTKIYGGCIIDGDVLMSVFDDDGDFIEQTIEGYFETVTMPETYTDPTGMAL